MGCGSLRGCWNEALGGEFQPADGEFQRMGNSSGWGILADGEF